MANYDYLYKTKEFDSKNDSGKRLMARFIKYGKLVCGRNPIKMGMGVEISAGDLLKKMNIDATSPFHNDQCNPPKATQIANITTVSSTKDMLFLGANTSK